jgi:hypothetical protein
MNDVKVEKLLNAEEAGQFLGLKTSTIRRIREQGDRGTSLREDAADLTRGDVAPKVGTTWRATSVRDILRRADRPGLAA